MSSVDEAGVTVMSEDGVTVTSDDGDAEDGALRDDQVKLDDSMALWESRVDDLH
jgi:hypothetical protein